MPGPKVQAVDQCRLLAMVKINTPDRAVKALVRHEGNYQDHGGDLRIFSAG